MPDPLIRITPESRRQAAAALLEAGTAIGTAAERLAFAAQPALERAGRAIADLQATDPLTAIDRALDGLCPCGADPAPGSVYCSYDCTPTHRGIHTSSDTDGTQMRWRPDLVTAADDSRLELIDEYRRSEFNATVYRQLDSDLLHFRLDDGNRYVGVDVPDEADMTPIERRDTWARLERELGNSRHLETCGCDPEDWRLTPEEMRLVTNLSFPAWLSEAVERAEAHSYATSVAQSGRPDPRLHGSVFIAPVGSDPADRSAWTVIGSTSDGYVETGEERGVAIPDQVTMTLDNRDGWFEPVRWLYLRDQRISAMVTDPRRMLRGLTIT